MHETMMQALNTQTPEKNPFKKELEFAMQMHERDKKEWQERNQDNKKIYDKQIIEMRETIAD